MPLRNEGDARLLRAAAFPCLRLAFETFVCPLEVSPLSHEVLS